MNRETLYTLLDYATVLFIGVGLAAALVYGWSA